MGLVIGIVIAAVAVLVALVLVAMYNRLVRLRNRSENAWAQVDVQLRKRYDLIPNLVETIKGYAAHERETFQAVTEARTRAEGAKGVQEQAQAENVLTAALGRLFAVAEAYPQLRATENFQQLQAEISDIENKIAASRRFFNNSVQEYNTGIQQFPAALFASMFGFTQRPFFDVGPDRAEVEKAPQVKF